MKLTSLLIGASSAQLLQLVDLNQLLNLKETNIVVTDQVIDVQSIVPGTTITIGGHEITTAGKIQRCQTRKSCHNGYCTITEWDPVKQSCETYETGFRAEECFGPLSILVVPVKMAFGGIKNLFFGKSDTGKLQEIDESLLVTNPNFLEKEEDFLGKNDFLGWQ